MRPNHVIKSAHDAGYTRANGFSLWGENGIDLADMGQGSIGNCWFISGAATMAERPGRIDKVFDNVGLNDAGFYQVQMYKLGSPITIQIDDKLPLTENSQTVYAEVSKDGALWGPLIEKAFAKYHGNYDQLVAGVAGRAIGTLTGAPYETLSTDEFDEESLWQMINDHDEKNFMFNAGSNQGSGNDQIKSKTGIANGHAYTLLGAYDVNGTKLFKMRNPWGSETYNSNWSDADPVWNTVSQSEKDKIGFSQNDDGIFFIPMNIFLQEFDGIDLIMDTEQAHSASFLRIGDDSSHASAKDVRYDSASNVTAHDFIVKSDVDQTIYVTGYVHDERSYPNTTECENAFSWGGISNAMYIEDGQYYHTWYEGQKTIKKEMKAGQEAELHTEWAWGRQGITKDFGVTVFGADGGVSITHVDGLQSQSWPHDQFDIAATGTPYAPPTSAVTSRDLSAVANKWASSKIWTNCTFQQEWSTPFSGVDSRQVFMAGNRCLTKNHKATFITLLTNVSHMKMFDSNHADLECTPWVQYPSYYAICEVTTKVDEAFAVLVDDSFDTRAWYFYAQEWISI